MTQKKKGKPPAWLASALDYIPQWLAFQLERHRQVGCTVAIVREGELVAEWAFGHANLKTRQPLTPRHRMRIASHSKAFTACAVLLLREQGKVGLDDPIGRHVPGLQGGVARVRVGELLSHGGGLTRDGDDSGQFTDRLPFRSREELLADLAKKQPLEPGLQLKYSNHGYGLLGLLVEELAGTGYAEWMQRHVLVPLGLQETSPDMPHLPKKAPMAVGHSTEFPFGQRLVVPGDNACNAIAAAGGFVATAADTARFFAQLDPAANDSVLTPASRRDMAQRRWRDPVNTLENWYGLGLMMSAAGPREWVGHTGSLQGFLSRTSRFAASGCTVTVLCNALDGLSYPWVDGIAGILDAFQRHGAPGRREAAWGGRWWNLWGAIDLVPMGKVVAQVSPAMTNPFDAGTSEARLTGTDRGLIHHTSGYNSPGQTMRLERDGRGRPKELWLGGARLVTREALVKEATARYAKAG